MRRRGTLRVTAGALGGRLLRVPPGQGTRPPLDRVRVALFDALGDWIVGRVVLDLFAGAGSLGIEALSRGASRCVFVESGRRALEALRANVAALGIENRSRILARNARAGAPAGEGTFGLVFLDPPYPGWREEGMPDVVLPLRSLAARGVLEDDARILLRCPAAVAAAPLPNGLRLLERRPYGTTAILVLGAVAPGE